MLCFAKDLVHISQSLQLIAKSFLSVLAVVVRRGFGGARRQATELLRSVYPLGAINNFRVGDGGSDDDDYDDPVLGMVSDKCQAFVYKYYRYFSPPALPPLYIMSRPVSIQTFSPNPAINYILL